MDRLLYFRGNKKILMEEASECVLNFLHAMEQLKHECRHSWTSQGRQESVIKYSWLLALMLSVCSLPQYLNKLLTF